MSARAKEIALRAVAALAEKLAEDVRNNRLWEGEYASAYAEIARNLQSAKP